MSNEILFIILGLIAGIFSGIIGLGGGVIIVPALVFIFGMSQQQAQGTTLALMVPPIGILAAYTYYQSGFVNLKVAGLVCLGFIFGGWLGAKIAVQLPKEVLQKIFAIVLLFLAVKMFFAK
jgi:uncharacterized membrane protein YfcA